MVTRFTLHAHESSASGCASATAREMARAYDDAGFDLVGFVGHDEVPDLPDDLPIETVAGYEETITDQPTQVHVVRYPQYDLSIFAHPLRSNPWDTTEATATYVSELGADAVERYSAGAVHLPEGAATVPVAAGDDAHNRAQVGTSYMEADVPATGAAVAQAVKQGNVDIINDPAGRLRHAKGRVLKGFATATARSGLK